MLMISRYEGIHPQALPKSDEQKLQNPDDQSLTPSARQDIPPI